MNCEPPIQIVKTIDVALYSLFPKVQMIKSKGIVFEKTPTRPHTRNVLI